MDPFDLILDVLAVALLVTQAALALAALGAAKIRQQPPMR
jgi:hypothetical protein